MTRICPLSDKIDGDPYDPIGGAFRTVRKGTVNGLSGLGSG